MEDLCFCKTVAEKDTVSLILICIAGYFVICLYALTLRTLVHFAILAFGVGCFQGSIQSLSRSYYSKNYSGGEFGRIFWHLRYFAKGASLPWICSHCSCKAGGRNDQRSWLSCLAVFFALGFGFFSKIADHQPMAGENKKIHSIKISKPGEQRATGFEIFAFDLGFTWNRPRNWH